MDVNSTRKYAVVDDFREDFAVEVIRTRSNLVLLMLLLQDPLRQL